MAESREVETHELTEAEVEAIHSKGSPHQHLDPTPHDDYFETLKSQKVQQFDFIKAKHLRKVKNGQSILNRLDGAKGKVIPRYLRRALFSGDEARVEACIDKALGEGWSELELEDQVNLLSARIMSGEEIE
jgi:hypothetical protein